MEFQIKIEQEDIISRLFNIYEGEVPCASGEGICNTLVILKAIESLSKILIPDAEKQQIFEGQQDALTETKVQENSLLLKREIDINFSFITFLTEIIGPESNSELFQNRTKEIITYIKLLQRPNDFIEGIAQIDVLELLNVAANNLKVNEIYPNQILKKILKEVLFEYLIASTFTEDMLSDLLKEAVHQKKVVLISLPRHILLLEKIEDGSYSLYEPNKGIGISRNITDIANYVYQTALKNDLDKVQTQTQYRTAPICLQSFGTGPVQNYPEHEKYVRQLIGGNHHDESSIFGIKPLTFAAQNGDVATVKKLLMRRNRRGICIDINHAEENRSADKSLQGSTALSHACSLKHSQSTAKILLAIPCIGLIRGYPLEHAIVNNQILSVFYILRADFYNQDKQLTVTHIRKCIRTACIYKHLEILTLLLQYHDEHDKFRYEDDKNTRAQIIAQLLEGYYFKRMAADEKLNKKEITLYIDEDKALCYKCMDSSGEVTNKKISSEWEHGAEIREKISKAEELKNKDIKHIAESKEIQKVILGSKSKSGELDACLNQALGYSPTSIRLLRWPNRKTSAYIMTGMCGLGAATLFILAGLTQDPNADQLHAADMLSGLSSAAVGLSLVGCGSLFYGRRSKVPQHRCYLDDETKKYEAELTTFLVVPNPIATSTGHILNIINDKRVGGDDVKTEIIIGSAEEINHSKGSNQDLEARSYVNDEFPLLEEDADEEVNEKSKPSTFN